MWFQQSSGVFDVSIYFIYYIYSIFNFQFVIIYFWIILKNKSCGGDYMSGRSKYYYLPLTSKINLQNNQSIS